MITFDPNQLSFTANTTDYRIFYRGIPIFAAGTVASPYQKQRKNPRNAITMREAARAEIQQIQHLYPHREHIHSVTLDKIAEIDATIQAKSGTPN